MNRITGLTNGEKLKIYTDAPKLELSAEQIDLNGGKQILIEVHDDGELLGRIILTADDITIWQAGALSGPTIEWIGLGYTPDLSDMGI